MSEVKAKINSPAFHILLPVCSQSKEDVFVTILKRAVARSKLDEHHLIRAFMSGMKGESFAIKMDDLTLNWEQLKSEKQQIRQAKLLGFWAIVNFPSLKVKLFGETHQATRNHVSITNTAIDAAKIDEVVFEKMKLRVVELRLKGSTFDKLKHFVKVPGCVGATRSNEIHITPSMDSFDVDAKFIESCWDALRCGEFLMSPDNEVSFLDEN